MSVPTEFLRGVLGMISLGCAYMAGRAVVGFREGRQKISGLNGWLIRLTLCLAAVAFRHSVDMIDIAIWALAAVAFAGGYWGASRRKPPEDLTSEIFPDRE
jgi:hypothetical protein